MNNREKTRKEYDDAKMLFVGGVWNERGGRPSKLAHTIFEEVYNNNSTIFNGGNYRQLERIVGEIDNYELIYWFPDIPNSLPKLVGEIKKTNQKSILVTSKQARDYSIGELISHALKNKSNLFMAVDWTDERPGPGIGHPGRYYARILDPLGNMYGKSFDFYKIGRALKKRSAELINHTRAGSAWLSSGHGVPENKEFFELIEQYADKFHEIIHGVAHPERFLGNASFRCEYGFPSFRKDNHIYATRRNVDKRHITTESFVPVAEGLPVRYTGPHKPSVDTPIQVALYEALPNINYMLHGHTYVRNGIMTHKPIPCGALEEVDAVLEFVRPEQESFLINLNGHGMLVGAKKLDHLRDLDLYARPMPEFQPGYIYMNERDIMNTNEMQEDLKVDIIDNRLRGKSVALCVSGGIAAIETPKLARQLRRHGADVRAYMTDAAKMFIGEAALEWATEQAVVSKLSGLAEHLCREDLVLVAPATMNTVNKIYAGLADSIPTTLVASALGMKKPVLYAPTMHDSLWNNPIFQENIAKEIAGLHMIAPRESEGKRKMPRIDTLVAEVCRELSDDSLKGKRLLITGGPTPVKIDAVRRITNVFKGSLAVEIAKEAYLRGANVDFLLGDTGIQVPKYINTTIHRDLEGYISNVQEYLAANNYDASIFSAAVADYAPRTVVEGKIPSGGELSLEFEQTPKVIKMVREQYPDLYMTTFKYQMNVSHDELMDIACARLPEYQMVVANRGEEMVDSHKAYIVTAGGSEEACGKKEIAVKLLDRLGTNLKS